jgi:hypothetical protein
MKRLGVVAGGVALSLTLAATASANPTPLAQYGSSGEGAGELSAPGGTLVDAAGALYVAEEDNHRVTVFARNGSFLRAFGRDVAPGGSSGPEACTTSCQAGDVSGTGALGTPYGLGLTPRGDVLVADYGLGRITVWTPGGDLIRTFGTFGNGPGEFLGPIGIASLEGGAFAVADYGNNRVSIHTPDGDFQRAFGENVVPGGGTEPEVCTTSCQAGTASGGPGSLSNPTGVATGPDGNLYVGEQSGHRISVFSGAGAFLRAFGGNVVPGGGAGPEVCTTNCQSGTSGNAAGELSSPDAPAFAGTGDLHVGEQNNLRASVYTPGGGFKFAYGANVIPGGSTAFELCTIATGCQAGGGGDEPGALDYPFVGGFDCRGAVYFGEVANDRVERLGEPATKRPPCRMKLGKAKKNKDKGTAKLAVKVPEPGPLKLILKGKGVKKSKKKSAKPGKAKLAVKPKGSLLGELEQTGEAKIKVTVKGKPRAGKAQKKSKKVKLVLGS